MTLSVDGASLIALLLASIRVISWLSVVPPFATGGIPVTGRVVLSLGLSLDMAPTLATRHLPSTTPELLLAVLAQVVVGVAMGFVTTLMFSTIAAAGSLIDIFGGFSVAAAYDPLAMNSNAVFGRFHQMLAVLLMMVSGGYLLVIGGLLTSFNFIGLDGMPDIHSWPAVVTTAFSMFFTTALQIALPLIAVLFVCDLALALMTKVAPQLNAMNVMYPAKVGLTLMLVGLCFPMLPSATSRLVDLTNQALSTMAGAS
ncbi:MAG TPA: flagellar biosynthetic protein FliR [Nocardioides sp.]|nr:flagellar biosynthetic protein FliR [Nocardioides sp.]